MPGLLLSEIGSFDFYQERKFKLKVLIVRGTEYKVKEREECHKNTGNFTEIRRSKEPNAFV